MIAVLVVAAGYLLGAVPTGLLLVRGLTRIDIRERGSGNIGAVNVYRVAGLPAAMMVLALDMLKGAIPVLVARAAGQPDWIAILAGVAAIVGHNWSVFLRFGGGKGIAASFGVLLAVSPLAGLVAAAIWAAVVGLTRYASLGSILGVASVPLVMWWRGEARAHLVFGLVAVVFAVYRHRANIGRLLGGTELKITDKLEGG